MALHWCSRPTTGPQKKPCSCKHKVNPGELHLHLVCSASGPPSHFAPLFIHPEAFFTTAAWRWGQHRHVDHRPGCGRCQRCHPLGNEGGVICVAGGGKEKGILYLGTVLGTLEITSLRFSGHEPFVIETMTHPMQ